MDFDIVGPALFVGSIIWDLGRRFAERGQTIDPDDFHEVADMVESHDAHMDKLHAVQDQLKALQDLQGKIQAHEEALKTHADRIVEHGTALSGHARTLTALGLAKAVSGGKP